MKKHFLFIVILLFSVNLCFATHIVGGEVFYKYLGVTPGSGKSTYQVTVRLFRDYLIPCGNGSNVACLPPDRVVVGVYENGNGYKFIDDLNLTVADSAVLILTDYPACVTTKPPIQYQVKIYTATVALSDNEAGYIIAYENCCRTTTLNVANDNQYSLQNLPGVTYDCTIPGTKLLPSGHNSMAAFDLKKPDLICYNSRFKLDYSATDPDAGDSISFAFSPAYTSGEPFAGANDTQPAETPPYTNVTYNTGRGFSGGNPLGSMVTINPVTGQISGISPAAGLYVVSVIVYEWRNKINIAQHRKDFILRIENCNIPAAELNASYITCNGFDLTFTNESNAANINSYYWNFGDASAVVDTSIDPIAAHTYSQAGTYKVTLITNKGGECSDTATTEANIFPGFIPNFSVTGSCVQGSFVFTDKSSTAYGVVDSWRWNFGDPNSAADSSLLKNPAPYKYSQTGTITAELIVTNSKGCTDTLDKELTISDKPLITLPFRDTLICNVDSLQLSASSDANAQYLWTPVVNVTNANTANPVVHPQRTTTYYVSVDEGNGCKNRDSLLVNVTDRVTLNIGNDTLVCLTDTAQFHPFTNALSFRWSPAATLSGATKKNPLAVPTATTTYSLQANIGSCVADDDITVRTAPYPVADAGVANTICFGATTLLNASYQGTAFTWSPSNSLLNAATLTPLAGPGATTVYTFTARDNSAQGCPKPVSDTVTVVVIPPLQINAGRDTNIVAGQPLQMDATGAEFYRWSPSTGISNTNIANPVITLPENIFKISYAVKGSTAEGCSNIDSVTVYQYKTLPDIFIPSAFTPDNDGTNDILKPIVAGIKRFENFSVYNRLGQLLYTTSSVGQGWDGNFKGQRQPPGVYVFQATAIDYLDKHLVKKGTVVLIR